MIDDQSTGSLPERPAGMEIVEIQPVILGGDPIDPSNKTWVTRQQHFELVRYWNRVIRQLEQSS
ncbi:hypothetical protein [Mitsuaria sp. 7]|uniref:hypothetical protein n=1 Tax=Mitsuaria sp. 7 TaxID=1658665 RepID=UPI0007DE1461|nr:hypothetical protein [Mitsuaria sp. 7]ANH67492.1 hypothetical protein ABE85_07765 [Mitsuaria sp. 7]